MDDWRAIKAALGPGCEKRSWFDARFEDVPDDYVNNLSDREAIRLQLVAEVWGLAEPC